MKTIFRTNKAPGARQKERGSVLFYILIAVVLFAALSYAVSNMMRDGSGAAIGTEQSKTFAAEIINYGRAMRTAVQDIRISNGCTDTDISFENDVIGGYTNGSNESCQVFNPAGGDIIYQSVNPRVLKSSDSGYYRYGELYISGATEVVDVGTTCGAAGCMELILFYPFITDEVCDAINIALGVVEPGDAIPSEDYITFWPGEEFDGTYANAGIDRVIGDDATALAGHQAGCLYQGGSADYPSNFFYQVLIAR